LELSTAEAGPFVLREHYKPGKKNDLRDVLYVVDMERLKDTMGKELEKRLSAWRREEGSKTPFPSELAYIVGPPILAPHCCVPLLCSAVCFYFTEV
jgi:hypothetical protein